MTTDHATDHGAPTDHPAAEGSALRMFFLLEHLAGRDEFVTLQDVADRTGLPKSSLHRMLGQLENAGLLVRQSDNRHYGVGARLQRFAESLLLNMTQHGARHAALRELVEQVGETCNITALSGSEIIYLNRVETDQPLRVFLRPGARVPAHCTASGKMILAQMTPAQRRKLLRHTPLPAYTPHTQTDLAALEDDLATVRNVGYATDDEEYLAGMVCVAVPVPTANRRSNMCIALQAPTSRISLPEALDLLPALHRTAQTVSDIETEGEIASGGESGHHRAG